MDIVIYTNPETLEHKKGGDGGTTYYWEMTRPPKNFKVGDRIFFAAKGQVVGSFKCIEFNPEKDDYGDPINYETIVWQADSWTELKESISIKSFRGFRYKWWQE